MHEADTGGRSSRKSAGTRSGFTAENRRAHRVATERVSKLCRDALLPGQGRYASIEQWYRKSAFNSRGRRDRPEVVASLSMTLKRKSFAMVDRFGHQS